MTGIQQKYNRRKAELEVLLKITDKIKEYMKEHKSELLMNKREDEIKIEEIRMNYKKSDSRN